MVLARLTVLAALLLAGACAPAAGLPARQADIAGLITSVGDGTRTMLVEEQRDPNTGPKASVTIDGSTRIWAVSGQTATRAVSDALRVGASVPAKLRHAHAPVDSAAGPSGSWGSHRRCSGACGCSPSMNRQLHWILRSGCGSVALG